MTTRPRAPFVPLTEDLDDRLVSLAREKGVGTLSQAEPIDASEQGGGGGEPAEAPTPRNRMKSLNLELPDYVWTELKIRAVQRQTSLRHVVMTALLGDGVSIADVDMVEDGRRLR